MVCCLDNSVIDRYHIDNGVIQIMKLETRVLKAIKALHDARTTAQWSQAVHEYNRAQERYSKYHQGMRYAPYGAVNEHERHFNHD